MDGDRFRKWTNNVEENKQWIYKKIWKPNKVEEDMDLSGNIIIFDWPVSIPNFKWFSTVSVLQSQNEFSIESQGKFFE